MNDNNDDLKQEQSNEIIETPKTIEAKAEVTTPVIQEEVKASKQNKRTVIKEFPKKKSGMKAGTKTQLIILGVTLIFWIFLASSVISFIKSIGRRSKESQIMYSQINYNTSQPAPEAQTTVVEPVTTTEVAPPVETPVTTVPEPVNNTNVPQSIPETNNNVAPQQNTVNQVQNTQQYSAYDDYDLQVLEDDKHLFPPYQGAPLLKAELLEKHPELEGILNKLAGKITESQMSQMNYQVGIEGKKAEAVARDYLVKEGLLKK